LPPIEETNMDRRDGSAPPTLPEARILAEFANGLTIDALPFRIRRRTEDILLDAIASALPGTTDPTTRPILDMTKELFGPGSSSVIGGGTLSKAGATVVNAHLISSVSLCDIHYESWCHLTPEVVPPALVVGEQRNVTGAELLLAIAAGCEITARIGIGVNYPALHEHGWNASGVVGVFGAATAAGMLLHLDARQLTHALGIAGAQAAGSDAQRGTPTVRFHQPRAALSGLMGAELALRGFVAMDDILQHAAGGLYNTHSDGGLPGVAVAELGRHWELERLWLTQWPLAVLVRNPVCTLLELAKAVEFNRDDIHRVRISVSPRTSELYSTVPFETPSQAKTSLRYLAAVVLRDRTCQAEQFTPGQLADPATIDFANHRVEVVADDRLNERAVTVGITLSDGRELTHARELPRGTAESPLTRDEIAEKFFQAAADVLTDEQAAEVLAFVYNLEQQSEVRPLTVALQGRSA
jgi:2-methylcitrate dehydratase PrpD